MNYQVDEPPMESASDVLLVWQVIHTNLYHGALQDQFGDDYWHALERVRDKVELAAIEWGVTLPR